jgi:hypothetical protein
MKIHSITSSAREQRRWQVEAKRVRDLEVNNQLGFGGLMDRQVGGLLALEDMPRISLGDLQVDDQLVLCGRLHGRSAGLFENAIDIAGCAPMRVDRIRPVGDQAAGSGEETIRS